MTHNYPLTSLYGDYLRSLIGIAFMGTPFYFTLGNTFLMVIFGGLTLLFVVFGIRTGIRHFSVIETTPEMIAAIGPINRRIAWGDIAKVDLKYFSTSREKNAGKGWMQLKVCGGPKCLKMESNIEGFDQIANKVANAAFRNGAEMTETTVENFTAMGVTVDLPEEDNG
ncbi:MAG: hypothetical protein GKS00_05095 [Alphaproteobacteria bacterium]|nr:hypothetical protein [Alphaproteobacteria bacterium]